MTIDRRALAFTLIGWCAALLPADRASWAAAMRAELSVIEGGDAALSFAAGCVWGAIKERTLTMNFAVQSVRVATILGMVALALMAAMAAGRLADVQAPTALVFGLTSALFATGAVWSYLRGPLALVQAASAMIPFYIIAYAFVLSQKNIAPEWVNAKLYEALAVEGIVIWAALLAGGIFMLRGGTLSINTHREIGS